MRSKQRLLLVLLVPIIAGGGVLAHRLWRHQKIQALALNSVPVPPDITRWPAEFKQRLHYAAADIGLVKDPAAPLGELARLYHVNGFTHEATSVLRALRQIDPRNPRWAYYLADLRLKAHDQKEARQLLAETAALAPDYAPVHRQLAELLAQAGDANGAAEQRRLEKISSGGRTSFDPWISELGSYCYDSYRLQLLSDALLAGGQPADAAAVLQRAVQISPNDALFHDLLAAAYEAAGRLDEATGALQNGIKQAPDAYSLHVRLAVVLCRHQRAPEAVNRVQRALQQWPEQAELHAALGHSLLIAGRPAEAVEAFKAALARNDRLTEAHFNLGNCFIRLGRPAEAKASYERAVELRPDYAEALTVLGRLAIEAEDADAADRYGTALIALRADRETKRIFAGGKVLKANAAAAAGQMSEAEQYYRRGIEVDPSLGILHSGLGMVYVKTGRLSEAISVFQNYLRVAPDEPDGYFMLGHSLLDAGSASEARKTFAQGLAVARKRNDREHAAAFERLLNP